MKYIATSGFKVIASDLGDPNRVVVAPSERDAFIKYASSQAAWVPSTTDFVALADGVQTGVGFLWNWPAAPFGNPRPDPLLGWVITVANSALTRVIGAQMTVEYSWAYQPAGGYGVGAPPGLVTHKAVVEFTSLIGNEALIGLLPGQVVNGRTSLSLPYVGFTGQNDSYGNWIKVTGIPAGTVMRVRALTRYDVDFINLWPDIAAQLYGGANPQEHP